MNKRQKQVVKHQLSMENFVLYELEKEYKEALKDINNKIRLFQSMPETQSRVYHRQYQETLKKQVEAALEKLHSDEYATINQYLHDCYTDAFVGTMYDMHGQGVPIIAPIDQNAAIKAVMADTRLNKALYAELGLDVNKMKREISSELSRGIASGLFYEDIARNIEFRTGAPLRRAKLIARTESHRIQESSTNDARQTAKARGADVVKQWDATLDGKTRPTHRRLDGQIRETDEPFEIGGKKAMYPGDFGDPAEDCNCRCLALTRARAALDADELATLKDRAKYFGLDKEKDFEAFKKKYLKAAETLENKGKSGIIKKGNTEVRKWYMDSVSHIPDGIDPSLPMLERAKKAFEARNNIRTEARNMMADEVTKKRLNQEHPNKTFEELVKSKMLRKGMSREEAIEDIYKTATKTNENVNKELGLED